MKLLSKLALLLVTFVPVFAQNVSITGTITNPDSSNFTGTLDVSWPRYVTFAGGTVEEGDMVVPVTNGALATTLYASDRMLHPKVYTVRGKYSNGVSFIDFWFVSYTGSATTLDNISLVANVGGGHGSGNFSTLTVLGNAYFGTAGTRGTIHLKDTTTPTPVDSQISSYTTGPGFNVGGPLTFTDTFSNTFTVDNPGAPGYEHLLHGYWPSGDGATYPFVPALGAYTSGLGTPSAQLGFCSNFSGGASCPTLNSEDNGGGLVQLAINLPSLADAFTVGPTGAAPPSIVHASIGTVPAGKFVWCPDCAVITCAGSGTGAWVFGSHGGNTCPF